MRLAGRIPHTARRVSTPRGIGRLTTLGSDGTDPKMAQKMDWDGVWTEGVPKGMRWDIGRCEPELVHELALGEKGTLAPLFARRDLGGCKALVPGCGRGYAVAAIAQAGIPAVGMDLSPTAMEIAQQDSPHPLAKYVVGDFFDESSKAGPFDLIFDSTFLCAIPPSMWRQWAKRTVSLLAPNGLLALQVFPVLADPAAKERDPDSPGDEPGPPNRLTINLVRNLLKPYSAEVEETAFRETPPERGARQSAVRTQSPGDFTEYWMVFRRKA